MITGKEMEKLKIIPPDAQIYAQVKASWDKIAKPLDGLGQFETMFAQIGAITGSSSLSIEKKVILTMCADNGVVAEGVSQSGQEVTAVVAGFMGQQASSVGKMARRAGVDVIPVDIGINTKETLPGVRDCKVMQGTRDFLQEPAMTEEEALQALSVGIDLVRECKDKDAGDMALDVLAGNDVKPVKIISTTVVDRDNVDEYLDPENTVY